jgi:hypothetical protein
MTLYDRRCENLKSYNDVTILPFFGHPLINVGFEALTAVVMKIVNRRFGGTCHLHLQDQISRARYQRESR